MLTALDELMLRVVGQLAGRSPFLDAVTLACTALFAIRLLPLMAVLVYLWFRTGNSLGSREAVVETVIGMRAAIEAIIAMLAAGIIACTLRMLLPFRGRPYLVAEPDLLQLDSVPASLVTAVIESGTSFPCDHAAIVSALATSVWLLSRPLGGLCFGWAVLTTCLPRIYVGYHYASDILCGVLIGVAVALCVRLLLPTLPILGFANRLALRRPALFQVALFTLMFQSAMVIDEIRIAFQN
ncbi:phosphatase PAP2 family protein [Methylobacterium segetis]|uniref:phosphatase PAP2 family protein n=1 Tax=Methylobacterium segetis TaxID=2488750 RepID=UPI00104AE3AB|nr:phosphatase PAP2 family protein [Methylobacterium segetis]